MASSPRRPFSGSKPGPRRAFTLIELLVVVAIVALLAAIAVANLLEAQTRAKVSRARNDLRTIATALETYRTDHPEYPLNDGIFNVVPNSLSTPVAYLSGARLVDPFTDRDRHPEHGDLARFYTYQKIVRIAELIRDSTLGYPPPLEAVDNPLINPDALGRYGKYRLVSNGPDGVYSTATEAAKLKFPGLHAYHQINDPFLLGADVTYDPTNGTHSWGNILRTQKSTTGEIAAARRP